MQEVGEGGPARARAAAAEHQSQAVEHHAKAVELHVLPVQAVAVVLHHPLRVHGRHGGERGAQRAKGIALGREGWGGKGCRLLTAIPHAINPFNPLSPSRPLILVEKIDNPPRGAPT